MLKQRLVGTALGHWAESARNAFTLVSAYRRRPDVVEMLASDMLATRLLGRLCLPERTFIDVGSHIGSVIAEVARYSPRAKIVSVEPIPEKVAVLKRKFPAIVVHQCALGESDGEAPFYIDARRTGFSSLGKPIGGSAADLTEIRVPVRQLDGLVDGAVDVIKIDVEGAELAVLRGGEQLISKNRPTILFESGPPGDDSFAFSKEAIWDWFASKDYVVVVPSRLPHDDGGLSREGFLESHLFPRRATNYFGVAVERRNEIRNQARRALKIHVEKL